MPRIITLCLALCWASSAAHAGAWLREQGTGFASLSFGISQFSETTNALYLEYGLSDSTTIGLDISAFTNSQNVRNGLGTLFFRRALGSAQNRNKFAYEIGLGGLWGNDMQLPVVKTTLSWGTGFEQNGSTGWMTMDLSYVHEPRMGQDIIKLDGTLGLALNPMLTGLIQFTLSGQDDDAYGAVEPSLLFRPKGRAFDIKIGAEIPYGETEKTALKLGLWRRF